MIGWRYYMGGGGDIYKSCGMIRSMGKSLEAGRKYTWMTRECKTAVSSVFT